MAESVIDLTRSRLELRTFKVAALSCKGWRCEVHENRQSTKPPSRRPEARPSMQSGARVLLVIGMPRSLVDCVHVLLQGREDRCLLGVRERQRVGDASDLIREAELLNETAVPRGR